MRGKPTADIAEAAQEHDAAFAKGMVTGDDEAGRGWPANALVPPSIRSEKERHAWVAGYVKGYNIRKASGSVLPLRV